MDYANVSIGPQNIANRESAVVLKNIAIKQNDQITALQFYICEMEKHYADLKEGRHKDRIILRLERWTNNFGTEPWRAILWLLGSNIVFAIIYVFGGHVRAFSAFTSPVFWLQVLKELFNFLFISSTRESHLAHG